MVRSRAVRKDERAGGWKAGGGASGGGGEPTGSDHRLQAIGAALGELSGTCESYVCHATVSSKHYAFGRAWSLMLGKCTVMLKVAVSRIELTRPIGQPIGVPPPAATRQGHWSMGHHVIAQSLQKPLAHHHPPCQQCGPHHP